MAVRDVLQWKALWPNMVHFIWTRMIRYQWTHMHGIRRLTWSILKVRWGKLYQLATLIFQPQLVSDTVMEPNLTMMSLVTILLLRTIVIVSKTSLLDFFHNIWTMDFISLANLMLVFTFQLWSRKLSMILFWFLHSEELLLEMVSTHGSAIKTRWFSLQRAELDYVCVCIWT